MLSLDRVSAGYAGFQALFDVSLEVKAGESVAVIGPNGAGKTTLLRLISKLIDPMAGEVVFEKKSLKDIPAHEVIARGIAHVPENRRLFPRLTVEENLKMGSFVPSARKDYEKNLDFVFGLFPRMKERRAQAAGTLSGGEQQMLAVSRALMLRPRLMLLDEPSFGLAPLIVQELFEILRTVNGKENVSMLVVEQNAAMALELADHAYLIETGRVVLSGTTAEIKRNDAVRRSYLGY